MTSELFPLHATTHSNAGCTLASCLNAVYSGAMYLTSDLWSGYVANTAGVFSGVHSFIQVPKGCAFKIWESKVYGTIPGRVAIEVSNDSGASYRVVGAGYTTVSGGGQTIDRAVRPTVIEAHDSMKRIRFNAQALDNDTTGGIYGDYLCEIVEINGD